MSDKERQLSAAIDAVPWHRHFHAFDVATDTPEHLRDVIARRRLDEAVAHFQSAIVHGGTIWSVSPHAFELLIKVLSSHPVPTATADAFLHALGEASTRLPDGCPVVSPERVEAALDAWAEDVAYARETPVDDEEDDEDVMVVAFESFFDREQESTDLFNHAVNGMRALRPVILEFLADFEARGLASPEAIADARDQWQCI